MALAKRSRLACALACTLLLAWLLLALRNSGPARAVGLSQPRLGHGETHTTQRWFVRPGGSGSACAQSAPCALQTALANAAAGDEVWLAAGVYTGTGDCVLAIARSIQVYAGWDGNASGPAWRAPQTFASVLDGQEQRRVIQAATGIALTLDGVRVVNGRAAGRGGGLYAQNAALTLRDAVFERNLAVTASGDAYGGAACIEGGSLRVLSCTFRYNAANCSGACYSNGGALYISGTLSASVESSLFEANDAWIGPGISFQEAGAAPLEVRLCTFRDGGQGLSVAGRPGGYGGGIDADEASVVLVGNAFIHNRANENGGAVHVRTGDATLERNLMSGNEASFGSAVNLEYWTHFTLTNEIITDSRPRYYWYQSAAAIHVEGRSDGSVLHNTLARNADGVGGYGLQVMGHSSVRVINTILVSHTVGISVGADSSARLDGTLWGAGDWMNQRDAAGAGALVTGTVNVYGPPDFVNPAGGDYHIGPASAAIDRGVASGVDYDYDGEPRPRGADYDIGADELGQPTPTPSATPAKTPTTPGVTATASPSASRTATPTITPTLTRSATPTRTVSATPSATRTPTSTGAAAPRRVFLPVLLRRAAW